MMGLKQVSQGVEDKLNGMIARGRSPSAYINRILVQQYKDAQNERWQTENASQGSTWEPLSPRYAKQKPKRFASFPGGGNALMVATSRLSMGAQLLDSSYGYKIVTDRSFVVGINLGAIPYAQCPGTRRPFMSFSDDTIQDWKDGLKNYIKGAP